MTRLGDRLVSWLRTIVPGLWALGIAWLVGLGLPDSVTGAVDGLGQMVLIPAALAIVYPLLRAVEEKMPPWLTRVLLGSNQPPNYGTSADGTPVVNSLPPAPPPRGGDVD
ncbi:hypothetical protein ACFORH_42935 [Amycolatopsis roodepoortensis]|uniref:Uncharacterized protein n=1 Tax=Amycolatopsis roodepoortensis TaxID=700274 RepID=A0ABR9L3X4_9PSEU|nr:MULTISPECIES: hypothetical protein [Amycolatopsis]MBE1575072.1 hypothetical protein [Amycolatopsis roodepoortensis]GHG97529.1 hypothetical protein GCM10017788_77100 [Amycolatopsis acidiphila]